ncbi:MAG: dynamin family protein [Actinobacteria bacterium]|nr:dynamin family protein [Actinomycetota bacterium]
MAQQTPVRAGPVGGTDAVAAARTVVEHGLRACEAYSRPDLADRLTAAQRRLADPGTHIVVVGEFKQGKSSLVNALVGVTVCPVDDDVATALPTYVRHGEQTAANVVLDGDPPLREPIAVDQIRLHAVEGGGNAGGVRPDGRRVAGVEVLLPRSMLASGLVVVDTPGLGGLGSTHAAASLAATSMADAVLFVTDASQELTATEMDFLRRARDLCGTVLCVMTKTDFYPAWRQVRDLNTAHLVREGLGEVRLLPVSSALRTRAVKTSDAALNTESGFRELVRVVTEDIGVGGATRAAQDAAREVVAVCEQLAGQFRSERSALADPASAQRVIDDLTQTKSRVESLRTNASRWNQTLSDGISDVSADIEHDLRGRIRRVVNDADDALGAGDPADSWPQMEAWLQSRISYELVANYTYLRDRASDVSAQVGEHFREVSGDDLGLLAVYNPTPLLSRTEFNPDIKLERMTARKQTMVALKGSYSGILMFTMLPSLLGVTGLAPIAIPIGLLMGRAGLRDEKRRQLTQRQAQAKNAVRRYCDEIQFVMGKDSRDTLRRIQRQLRDHYTARADELNRSTSQALQSATESVKRTQADRDRRVKDLDAELGRLAQLRQRAEAVGG